MCGAEDFNWCQIVILVIMVTHYAGLFKSIINNKALKEEHLDYFSS